MIRQKRKREKSASRPKAKKALFKEKIVQDEDYGYADHVDPAEIRKGVENLLANLK